MNWLSKWHYYLRITTKIRSMVARTAVPYSIMLKLEPMLSRLSEFGMISGGKKKPNAQPN